MVVVHAQDDTYRQQSTSILNLFPARQKDQDQTPSALTVDFFDWLETAWKLPLSPNAANKVPLPVPFDLLDGIYTVQDLHLLYGYDEGSIHIMLKRFGIVPTQNGKGGHYSLYKKLDLAPLINSWERQRLLQTVDQWWLRFFSPACGVCWRCQKGDLQPAARQIHCDGNASLMLLRAVFTAFIEEISRLGSIEAWWQAHQAGTWKGKKCSLGRSWISCPSWLSAAFHTRKG